MMYLKQKQKAFIKEQNNYCFILQMAIITFLCIQEKVDPSCEMTERRIFTMAKQVASALVSMPINTHILLDHRSIFKSMTGVNNN